MWIDMKLFELKTAILIVIIYVFALTFVLSFANQYLGLYGGMYVSAGAPVPLVLYFLAYVWKWNKGEAKFF